jgi:hypothetical protein
MGITVGSIGLGAVFPSVNRITAPFVCSKGRLELVTQDYHPSPVEVVTTLTWYCVDENTGARQEVSPIIMALIAGPLYGLLLFLVVMEVMWIRSDQRGLTPGGAMEMVPPRARGSARVDGLFRPSGKRESPEQRLQELKRLRESGLITDGEYDRKKAEILSDL